MDSVLKDLRAKREAVEAEFNQALENLAELQSKIAATGETEIPASLRGLLEAITNSTDKLSRQMHALDNARSAELARQLTELPISRMDHIIDKLERRLETLESRLARLEKE